MKIKSLDKQETKTFKDFVEFAANYNGKTIEDVACDIEINLSQDDEPFLFHAYSVSISSRELTFYGETGYLSYVIDLYGTRPVAELFDFELEQ
jgi:hypothetical protein